MNYQLLYLCLLCLNVVNGQYRNQRKLIENKKKQLDLEERIVGGRPASLSDYPYNVMFMNYGGLCGGTILSKKIVMTAAHCFSNNQNLAEMTVISNARYAFDVHSVKHKVWQFVRHNHYNDSVVFDNDIALIMIKDTFNYGKFVRKATIVDNTHWMSEKWHDFTATGWGETSYGGPVSKNGLLKTHLRYISQQHCAKANQIKLTNSMFCLYGEKKRDTCRGDSGGGILWNGTIVGIVSFGSRCATTPAIYTNTYYMKPWVMRTIKLLYREFRSSLKR